MAHRSLYCELNIYFKVGFSERKSLCQGKQFCTFIRNGRWKPCWVLLIRGSNQIRETKWEFKYRLIDKGIPQWLIWALSITEYSKHYLETTRPKTWCNFWVQTSDVMFSLIQTGCGAFNLKIFSLNLLWVWSFNYYANGVCVHSWEKDLC